MKISLLSLLCPLTLHLANGNQLRGIQQRDLQAPGTLLCKMYTKGTTYEDDEATEEQVCAPIVDGVETESLIPLKLPKVIQDTHQHEIRQGLLLVHLTHAEITRRGFNVDIAINSDNEFVVVNDDPRLRHLQERKLQTTGEITVAIVRISTKDSSPTATRQQMMDTFDEELVNFKTQYDLCSNGKLNLKKASDFVVNVSLNTNIDSSTSPASLITEASERLGGAQKLADKVFFCIPPGTGNWAASSSMNYWRAQFNDPFCTSVSAMAHEFGHLIGLPHSNENGARYGDQTGYMARSFRNANWPRRCFNGANSGFLGWYKDKTLEMSENDSPRLVKLAGVVDYKKAADDEYVLVDIGNNKWIQYNRAKWFNNDSGEYHNTVIISEMQGGGTDVLGTVLPGETLSSGNLKVKCCKRVAGVNDNSADYMLISVGKGTTLACPDSGNDNNGGGGGNENGNGNDNNGNNNDNNGNNGNNNGNNSNNGNEIEQSQEKVVPTKSPTKMPTKAPTKAPATKPPTKPPTKAPTKQPTKAPSKQPTKAPTKAESTDTRKPTRAPTEEPTTAPTQAPSLAPSDADGDQNEEDGDGQGDSKVAPSINASTGSDNWWVKLWSLPRKWFSF